MRTLRAPLLIVLLLWAALAGAVEGDYRGVGVAEGMALTVARDGSAYRAALVDAAGVRTEFDAAPVGAGMEGEADLAFGRALVRVTPEAVGVALVVVPFDADGALLADERFALAFRRADVDAPAPPDRYLPPPQQPLAVIDARAFVDSYPFWPPQAVAWGYGAVKPALRTVIRLFPLVQADILWKMCASPVRGAALGEALRGQGLDCRRINAFMTRAQAGETFDRFKRDVAAARDGLMVALACAENLARNDPRCAASAEDIARRAVSMETAQTVLRRY